MANRKYANAVQAKKAKRAVQSAYKKRAYKMYAIRYHVKNDADVISRLESVDNKADYIRRLIREDIERK